MPRWHCASCSVQCVSVRVPVCVHVLVHMRTRARSRARARERTRARHSAVPRQACVRARVRTCYCACGWCRARRG
eukprot:8890971-Alexandrium_andersonii.AAC.1